MTSKQANISKKAITSKRTINSPTHRMFKLAGFLWLLVFINAGAMMLFEAMSLGDALWLSFTTLTTVGYGDYSPASFWGRFTTVVTMYSFAISVLSLLAAEIIDWRLAKTEKNAEAYGSGKVCVIIHRLLIHRLLMQSVIYTV